MDSFLSLRIGSNFSVRNTCVLFDKECSKKKMQPGGGKIQAGNGNTDRKLMLTSSLNHKIVMVLSTWEITEQFVV